MQGVVRQPCCCRRHGPLHHYCWWNKHVANPIKKWGYVGNGRKAMQLLKRDILTRILLRRTKVQCADVLALPPRCDPSAGAVVSFVLHAQKRCPCKWWCILIQLCDSVHAWQEASWQSLWHTQQLHGDWALCWDQGGSAVAASGG